MTWRVLVEAAEAIRDAAVGAPTGGAASIAGLPIVAIGWATVELDRAQRELDALLAADPGAPPLEPWAPAARDAQVGATCQVRVPTKASVDAADRTPALVALEPDTEGPLAAFLARFGEGVGVLYLGNGPFWSGRLGRGRLIRGGPMWGPHVIVLDAGNR